MKKTVLTFGLLSGAVSIALMVGSLPIVDRIGFDKGEILGYTVLVLSMLFVFFGVRSYRQNVGGGRLSLGRGLAVGILITVISGLCYVAVWEVIYFNFMPDFADKYSAYYVAKAKAAGATQEVIDAKTREMQDFKKMYDNPLANAALTFMEPFPLGVLATVVSAVALRKK